MKKNVIRINESQLRQIVTESVKKLLKEDYDFSKVEKPEDFTRDEILKLVSTLEKHPDIKLLEPHDLGWCKLKRIEGNQVSVRWSLIKKSDKNSVGEAYYSKGINGELFLKIDMMSETPDTPLFKAGGFTYMCWKD
jgi:hypothetical protein